MISGSGAQNRNEEIEGHKPFLIWADHLSRHGIAVLRFDDRGTAQSTGDHAAATSADFATDVMAAIDYLKTVDGINKGAIGLIGHSEGGLIAPIAIADKPDDVGFFVSLAGPGISGFDILGPQMEKSAVLSGAAPEDAARGTQIIVAGLKVAQGFKGSREELSQQMKQAMMASKQQAPERIKNQYSDQMLNIFSQQFSTDWMRYFINQDPAKFLKQVKVPTLLLNGSLDYQIIPEDNLYTMEKIINSSGNKDVTVVELEGMNHLFQKVPTGAASEYGTTEETVNEEVLNLVSKWINERF